MWVRAFQLLVEVLKWTDWWSNFSCSGHPVQIFVTSSQWRVSAGFVPRVSRLHLRLLSFGPGFGPKQVACFAPDRKWQANTNTVIHFHFMLSLNRQLLFLKGGFAKTNLVKYVALSLSSVGFFGASMANASSTTIFDFEVKDIDENTVQLSRYKGFVTLIVNVASKWGLTKKNYTQLEELHSR